MRKLFIAGLLLLVSIISALEIGGKDLPDSLKIGEKVLQLNGAGIRKKMVINVYACGLYLMENQTDAQSIIDSDKPMAIRMHFIYKKVSSKKLIKAWNEGFSNSNADKTHPAEIKEFNSYFSQNALRDDVYEIIYEPETGTSVYINAKPAGTIKGLDFKKAVFSIWLGDHTALPKLKDKLLGEK